MPPGRLRVPRSEAVPRNGVGEEQESARPGPSCLGLARSYHRLAGFIRLSRDPITRKPLEEWNGAGMVAKFESGDPEDNDRRAEAYFKRVIAEFGDLKMPSPYNEAPFAGLARGELYELRHLGVGKVAPDLEGEDVGAGSSG